jgi:hypothetical protein
VFSCCSFISPHTNQLKKTSQNKDKAGRKKGNARCPVFFLFCFGIVCFWHQLRQ